jgi:hypothetical protein
MAFHGRLVVMQTGHTRLAVVLASSLFPDNTHSVEARRTAHVADVSGPLLPPSGAGNDASVSLGRTSSRQSSPRLPDYVTGKSTTSAGQRIATWLELGQGPACTRFLDVMRRRLKVRKGVTPDWCPPPSDIVSWEYGSCLQLSARRAGARRRTRGSASCLSELQELPIALV